MIAYLSVTGEVYDDLLVEEKHLPTGHNQKRHGKKVHKDISKQKEWEDSLFVGMASQRLASVQITNSIGVRPEFVFSLSAYWAGDAVNVVSQYLMSRVAKKFGLQDIATDKIAAENAVRDIIDGSARSIYMDGGKTRGIMPTNFESAVDKVVSEIYSLSQYELKKSGLDSLHLYRGTSQTNYELPLSSWTSSLSTAEKFASGEIYGGAKYEGTVVSRDVSISQIFSVSKITGFGNEFEREFIVLGEAVEQKHLPTRHNQKKHGRQNLGVVEFRNDTDQDWQAEGFLRKPTDEELEELVSGFTKQGLTSSIDISFGAIYGGIQLWISLRDLSRHPLEEEIGHIDRTFAGGNVDHHDFELHAQFQQRGMGTAFLEKSEELYRKIGVKKIRLLANSKVGRYAWARMGFDFDFVDLEKRKEGYALNFEEYLINHRVPKKAWPNGGDLKSMHTWDYAVFSYVGASGRDFMLGQGSWPGIKDLSDDSLGYKIGQEYYKLKHRIEKHLPSQHDQKTHGRSLIEGSSGPIDEYRTRLEKYFVGVSVSESVNQEDVKEALAEVEASISLIQGLLPNVDIRKMGLTLRVFGKYEKDHEAVYDSSIRSIDIGGNSGESFTHEFFHALDHYTKASPENKFPKDYLLYSTETPGSSLREIYSAAKKTDLFERLNNKRLFDADERKYYRDPTELSARAFEKWVEAKTGVTIVDPSQYTSIPKSIQYYWTDKEFKRDMLSTMDKVLSQIVIKHLPTRHDQKKHVGNNEYAQDETWTDVVVPEKELLY